LVWLGWRRVFVGQFVPLPEDIIVNRVAGLPPIMTLDADVDGLAFPITIPDATPVPTPALSPLVIGMVVPWLCAGALQMRTLYAAETPIALWAMFGYGMGTGAGEGGAGVRHVSGNPLHIPPAWVLANMTTPSQPM
jgi:hypothetical protein